MILADRFHYSADFLDKCESTLDLAFGHVPLYREWKRFDPGRDVPLDRRFDALPALGKADMRDHFPTGLMPDGKDLAAGLRNGDIQYTFTSGTTSEKVVNIWDQGWWNRSEAASWKFNRHLAALAYPQRQAKLASALNVGVSCEEDLPMGHRILGDTLYLNEKTSTLQWQPWHMRRMIDELKEYRPVILEANPSLLARLAYWSMDEGLEVFSPAAVVFTFEFPSAVHLAAIRKVFSSPFVSSYGSTETGFVLQQCECGLMHQNTSFCRIDFEPLAPGFGGPELGRIFVTTFGNPWNCVIRFDVGDLIRLHPVGDCRCGRAEGIIADAVEGRIGNATFAADGGLVTTKRLDDGLAAVGALRDYRLEQCGAGEYLLEAMVSPGADRKAAREELRGVLAELYGGGAECEVRVVDDILTGASGKFRRTQADFDFDEGALFR